ncbi:hypothetical protein HK107_02620 [Parvularcula sp. ZS-1/3]|uniref:PBP domain-containing protein n=1 Tax=Parvularcula mediterranea TaxID=2732508 RepID=A0A7Y3W4F4_9PROT|nr:substrate-binding domain-containing protein [Parvularcula mediterranea]NNU15217.1 hypothetical protein [Parvularcula mediterranea]
MLKRIALALCAAIGPAQAEETVIIGSSTVAPYARAVISHIQGTLTNKLRIDPQGSNAGIRALCSGAKPLTLSSRRMARDEQSVCAETLGTRLSEFAIGNNGVVLVTYRETALPNFSVTREELFRALAKNVPDADCQLVPNEALTWRDVSERLPDVPIKVFGPSARHGTYSSFVDLALAKGAKRNSCHAALEAQEQGAMERTAKALRTDGVFVVMNEERSDLVLNLHKEQGALGILDYGASQRLKTHLQVVRVEGRAPTKLTLGDGSYPLASPLWMYLNDAAVDLDEDLKAFRNAFMAEEAIGPGGYLSRIGLIPARH